LTHDMAERVTVTLHELVAELDAYADAVLRARHGVTFNLFEFLAALVERGPIDMTGLAQCLRITKAAVSKRVPGLVADGWVHTAESPHGRSVILTATDRARTLVAQAGGELEAEFTAMLAHAGRAADDLDGGPAAIDATALNAQLESLTRIVTAKARP